MTGGTGARLVSALRRVADAVLFLLVFLRELVVANAVVAWEVLTPGRGLRPGVARVPLAARTPGELTLLADALALTPGTLPLEVREPGPRGEPAVIYVHGLHVADADEFRRRVQRLERRLLDAMRGRS